MEEDDVKLKTNDDKLTGGVATGGVGFGVGDDGVQQSDNSKMGVSDGEMGQKVVSLKGVHTESEIEKQQELDEVKKKAVTLGKTEAEIKKEKELEEMKKKAVSLKDGQQLSVGGSQLTVNSGSDRLISGLGTEDEKGKSTPNLSQVSGGEALKTPQNSHSSNFDPLYTGGEKRKSTPNPSFKKGGKLGEARTVITPEGRLVELKDGEKFSDKQGIVNLKDAVQKKETGLDNQGGRNSVKNVVDLGSVKSTLNPSFEKRGEALKTPKNSHSSNFDPLYAGGEKGKSTPNPSFEEGGELEEWEDQKVDLSKLSSEQRINLQATPSLASVHQKMDDDLNGEVASWFDKYNELPINIKLGLGDTQTVQRVVKELADKFGVMTEEGLGEISRIVRDVYVDLIGESEIKKRAVNNLKITDDKLNDFLEEIAKIVALVREIGNKKTDEYFEKLSVAEILEKYPKIAEQDVTTGDIFDKKQQKYIAPTLKNWVDDYINNAGSDKHTSLERGKYLEESYNTKHLDEDDRRAVDMLTKSYDTGSKLLVDPQENVIYWRLHTDESGLGINSDKSKRVINHFKIEEAQKVDVDQGVKDNLEKEDKSSIIENEKDVVGGEEDVLDLSTELEKK